MKRFSGTYRKSLKAKGFMIQHNVILSLYNPNVVLSGTEQRRENQKLGFKEVKHFPVLS